MAFALLSGLALVAYVLLAWHQHRRASGERGQRERLQGGMQVNHTAFGQTFLYTATRDQTGGQLFVAVLGLDAYSSGPMACIHPRSTVSITVARGCLTLWVDGKRKRLGPGEGIVIAPRTPYRYFNAGDEPVSAQVEATPASALDMFLVQVDRSGLGHSGRSARTWLQAVSLFAAYDCTYVASLPVWLQRGSAILLGPLIRLLRIRTYYAE